MSIDIQTDFHLASRYPWPGDHIDDKTVVASVEAIGDERGILVLVLLLEKRAPYFTVAHYALTDFDPKLSGDPFLQDGIPYKQGELDVLGSFENIVPAVEYYKDNGGDY